MPVEDQSGGDEAEGHQESEPVGQPGRAGGQAVEKQRPGRAVEPPGETKGGERRRQQGQAVAPRFAGVGDDEGVRRHEEAGDEAGAAVGQPDDGPCEHGDRADRGHQGEHAEADLVRAERGEGEPEVGEGVVRGVVGRRPVAEVVDGSLTPHERLDEPAQPDRRHLGGVQLVEPHSVAP